MLVELVVVVGEARRRRRIAESEEEFADMCGQIGVEDTEDIMTKGQRASIEEIERSHSQANDN